MHGFYVAAYESGAEHSALPTWGCHTANPLNLCDSADQVSLEHISTVPGACQINDVLKENECSNFIELSETLEYLPDAAVSLPRSVRHNDNIVWVIDDQTHDILWSRIENCLQQLPDIFGGRPPVGLNCRFRFYRYQKGDYFRPHTDGAWPGSRIVDGELRADAFGDRFSRMSALFFLSDDFEGGDTQFMVSQSNPDRPAVQGDTPVVMNIRVPKGGLLLFPHGTHPLHCVHSSAPIVSGTKYIVRTDLLFTV
ncbi:MAG: oxidoreductase [Pseudomonadota bacterium]